jgi:hypothetical protein
MKTQFDALFEIYEESKRLDVKIMEADDQHANLARDQAHNAYQEFSQQTYLAMSALMEFVKRHSFTPIGEGLPEPLASCQVSVIDTFDGQPLVISAYRKPSGVWHMDDETDATVPEAFVIQGWMLIPEPMKIDGATLFSLDHIRTVKRIKAAFADG